MAERGLPSPVTETDDGTRLSRHDRFTCPGCRYDLTSIAAGVPDGVRGETELRCPECGDPTTAYAASITRPENRGWVYFLLWLGAALGLLSLFGCCGSVIAYAIFNASAGGP